MFGDVNVESDPINDLEEPSSTKFEFVSVVPARYHISCTNTDEQAMNIVKTNAAVMKERLRLKLLLSGSELVLITPVDFFDKTFLQEQW